MTDLAVVLAAGIGSRLRSVSEQPKALVPVHGRPLLGWLLEGCAEAGISEVVIVTGHRAGAIERFASSLSGVRLVHNPHYAEAGNARSLAAAREALAGRSFLKIDGDLRLAPALIAAMAARRDSAIACDRRAALDAEAMKVRLAAGRVVAVGKELADADAESLGLERIDARAAPAIFDRLETEQGYYEDAYRALLDTVRFAAHDVTEPWVEIDDPADLARAERMKW
jgi:choline kinase